MVVMLGCHRFLSSGLRCSILSNQVSLSGCHKIPISIPRAAMIWPRNLMSSPLVQMLPNKVLVPTNRIDIATRGAVETDLLGGIITTLSTQPTIGMTDILGGTTLLGGTKNCPNGTGTIVLGGTLPNRSPKGLIGNETGRHRRVIIKLHT